MKVTKEEKEKSKEDDVVVGKTILIGVKMDQHSKELLTWALVKVAVPGDHVIALHILPSSSKTLFDTDGRPLDKELESMLAVYEGFCNLKQIDLKLKVCRGSSIRRVLVREVKAFAATQLILGVLKTTRTIGPSSISVAKYCAKKLPRTCSVLAVSNGKIVFSREAIDNNKGSEFSSKSESSCGSVEINGKLSLEELLSERSCSICDSSSVPQGSKGANEEVDKPQRSNGAEEVLEKAEASSSKSVSLEIEGMPEVRHGWPIVRKSVLGLEKPKVSVIQWAMRLPARYSFSSAVYCERKLSKSDSIQKSNLKEEKGRGLPSISTHDKDGRLIKELESLQEKFSTVCRIFSYKELVDATSNFSSEKLIGKGGNSRVYKGCLSDGKQLAVKILKPTEDAIKEFVSEIEIITTLHHKHIVSLLGFCFDNDHLILVYNFLSRGSLEENLHDGENESKIVLSWAKRYKVAMGIAEALDYLHSGGHVTPVIHKDVKSSNILLSEDFEPQLSDFGLATWASASTSLTTCSDVAGTFGYLAPEYFIYGRVNEKIDVYAFGVVLLELLSGRKPISMGGPEDKKSIVMWAKPILQGGKAKELVDPCLSGEYDGDQMERMILAASLCIRRAARSRPLMSLVLKLLQGDEETLNWARTQVSTSEDLDELEDDEISCPSSNLQSYLNLALLDIEDDSLSPSSTEHTGDLLTSNTSSEDCSQGRWSRCSSFD